MKAHVYTIIYLIHKLLVASIESSKQFTNSSVITRSKELRDLNPFDYLHRTIDKGIQETLAQTWPLLTPLHLSVLSFHPSELELYPS